jgi:hypothetical protein
MSKGLLIAIVATVVLITAIVIPVAILVPKSKDEAAVITTGRSGSWSFVSGTSAPTIAATTALPVAPPSSFPSINPGIEDVMTSEYISAPPSIYRTTAVPTIVPSMDAPSTLPSILASLVPPSGAPSDRRLLRPSSRPSDVPSNSPTDFPATVSWPLPDVDPNYTFTLKMHWKPWYFWQEEGYERKWCLECTRCQNVTASESGTSVCRDENPNVFDCQAGDQLWLQTCNEDLTGHQGNAEFRVLRHDDGDQLQVVGTNFCVTFVRPRFMNLQQCQVGNALQLWEGFTTDKPFALHPKHNMELCASQHHHPKASELLFASGCDLAYKWNTALWETISVLRNF